MKTLYAFAFFLTIGLEIFAQNQGLIPRISQQLTDYFSVYPKDKVFIITDKQRYKPGETIWFDALVANSQTQAPIKQELIVRLYNNFGVQIMGDNYELNNFRTTGDLQLPENLSRGQYFLVAFISTISNAEDVFCTMLNVDPTYSDQWVVSSIAKDSISIGGLRNELTVLLRDFSGEIQKNTSLRYQLMNGKEIIEKGKLKTDQTGKAIVPFTLPAKSNGEPFILELSDNKSEWKKEVFLPSNLDPIVIRFYPEGGTIVPGMIEKIGFSAFNKWGVPVDIDGTVVDQDGKQLSIVRTFTKGLGLFTVTNDGKQKWKLLLSGKSNQTQIYELPAPNPFGLSFSVAKTDPEFIWVNLVFADKQKHTVAFIATSGSNINWAADTEMAGMGRLKIPKENLPQGVNMLSVFAPDGTVLACRLLFIDKKQALNVEVKPEKNEMKQGESMKVKIRLTDENNQPVSGLVSLSIADNFRKAGASPEIQKYLLAGPELETPFSLLSAAFHGQITNSALMDIFLIANKLNGFDWQTIQQFKHENAAGNKNFEIQLSDYISGIILKNSLLNNDLVVEPSYFSNNADLFGRAPKISKPNTLASDSQKRMLSTSTNLLDVIKVIKPFRIMNNQIVFIGSENSINFQGGALIVLDGQQMGTDVSNLQSVSPLEVDHINVSTNPMDIQRYTGLNSVGIIEIFTKKAEGSSTPEREKSTNSYNGEYRIPNVFPTDLPNPKRDFRTTLQWIPELKVDATGQAEISVTSGKVLSDFVIEVQGISGNCRIGSRTAKFSVVK